MNRTMRTATLLIFVLVLSFIPIASARQSTDQSSRIISEVQSNGQQMKYLSMLSDEIGSRLTGTSGARRAEAAMETLMKQIGLVNVHREPFTIPVSWQRGTATASLTARNASRNPRVGGTLAVPGRKLSVASYTWTPGTNGTVVGEVVAIGAGKPEDISKVRTRLSGAVALMTPSGASLDEVIYNFYRAPGAAKEVKQAGAKALLIASDKQHAMLYTAPVDFNGRIAALPTLSLANEDVGLIQRLAESGKKLSIQLSVQNKLGPAFQSTNVVGEIRGSEKPDEIVVIGAHLDSNDLGPGALDNGAGCAAVLETARAIKALGLKPRRTIRFVLFTGEEEGMLGSNAYVRQHKAEMDRTVAALIMDIGAGKPVGWFSMGRTDLDAEINALMKPLELLGMTTIEHSAFAATDNAAFMAEGVPDLILNQDETNYFPVHHTIADTPDKADPKEFAACISAVAATTFAIADQPTRFGRRLSRDEVKKIAEETKVGEQWRAAGIW